MDCVAAQQISLCMAFYWRSTCFCLMMYMDKSYGAIFIWTSPARVICCPVCILWSHSCLFKEHEDLRDVSFYGQQSTSFLLLCMDQWSTVQYMFVCILRLFIFVNRLAVQDCLDLFNYVWTTGLHCLCLHNLTNDSRVPFISDLWSTLMLSFCDAKTITFSQKLHRLWIPKTFETQVIFRTRRWDIFGNVFIQLLGPIFRQRFVFCVTFLFILSWDFFFIYIMLKKQ